MATKGRKVLAMKVPSFSSRSPTTVLALMMLFMQTYVAATACQLYLLACSSVLNWLCHAGGPSRGGSSCQRELQR